jgi:hypothetical protein
MGELVGLSLQTLLLCPAVAEKVRIRFGHFAPSEAATRCILRADSRF